MKKIQILLVLMITSLVGYAQTSTIETDTFKVVHQFNPAIRFFASPNQSLNNADVEGIVDWFYNNNNNQRKFRMYSVGDASTNIQLSTLRGNTGLLNSFEIQGGDYPSQSSVPSFVWNGPSSAQMFYYPDGDLFINGSVIGPSDIRLKKNIMPLKSALSSLESINGYKYNWIDESKRGSAVHIGLIAQEVQAVYPELVDANAKGELSVKYDKMIPVLVEAIKEQQAMIEELTATVQAQQNQIEALNTPKKKRSLFKRK